MTRRGTVHANDRGSAADRRARREWLMKTYGVDGICVCWRCEVPLLLDEITVDRYPIPGIRGGRYVRGNIRPACGFCNSSAGSTVRRHTVQPSATAHPEGQQGRAAESPAGRPAPRREPLRPGGRDTTTTRPRRSAA